MQRRKFMLGSTAAGVGLLFGTGAFSAAGTEHGVSIQTGDGNLHVELNDEYEGDAGAYVTEDPLELDVEVGSNEWIRFDDLLRVTNTGTQSVTVYVEDQEWLGDDANAVLDYRVADETVVGNDNGVTLEDPSGENSETFTVLVDATGHDTVEDALPDTDENEDTHTVRFVAETTDVDSGSGEEQPDEGDDDGEDDSGSGEEEPDEGDDDDGEDDTENEDGILEVEVIDTITPREVAEVTATVNNGTDETQSGTVTLDLTEHVHAGEGLDVDLEVDVEEFPDAAPVGDPEYMYIDRGEYPQELLEADVTVEPGESDDITFEVPAAYKNLEMGDLTLSENEVVVTADLDGGTESESDVLTIEDAPALWFQPDDALECIVCGMDTEHYEAWNAQATHADGTRIEFCSLGCAVAYWTHPEHFVDQSLGGTTWEGAHEYTAAEDLVTIWAPDFTDIEIDERQGRDNHTGGDLGETYEHFIDMREGYFVLDDETNDKFGTPMPGHSPVCFADYDDAVAYVNGELDNIPDGTDMGNVDEDDIVELDELADHEAGYLYRAGRLP
ncbi:nitrous oxide reductase accessory protein NosL [Natrarchaeobaculum aegyptiacum]|uniref:Uncharacterized protein n=1 Tax=Natrarchaeobaculum aegyptiacum TaxID=745377 RepID=A0A2Z2HZM6_9EURY|nr:nitrous oxide reductase accessory protein NosL [Natrarchaeobaculum aegyptiacum]ARS91467.1 hypothetical protein B1756_18230 [Natrarchaeobaculum aegyptiacum]